MTREVETTGKTIEEAIENAYAMLGVERDEVELSIEVIDRPKSGFLGIGSVPAKVRASYEIPDPEPEYKPEPRPERRERRPEPRREASPEPSAADSADVEREAPAESEPRPQKSQRRNDRPRRDRRNDYAQPPRTEHVEKIPDISDEELERRKNAAVEFLTGLLSRMGSDVSVKAETNTEDKSISITLEGANAGGLIGRRGDTLSAIQHITGYMANKDQDERVRVVVDAEGYREKREQTLESLARRTALKVVRLRHNITLEPMNAYERHIIHTALQDWRDVSTFSTGAEPRRAVVIAYTPSGGKGSGGGGERRERNDRRDRPRRDSAPKQPSEPKERTPLPEQVWE